MSIKIAERRELEHIANQLSDAAIEKMLHYAAFLRYEEAIEEREDAEDIAYIDAHKNDGPNVPLDEVIRDYEADHGPLR